MRARRPISACLVAQGCHADGDQSVWRIFRYHPIRLRFTLTTMGSKLLSPIPLILSPSLLLTTRSIPFLSLEQMIPDEFVPDRKFTLNTNRRVHDWVRYAWKPQTRFDFPRHAMFNRVFSHTRFSCKYHLRLVLISNISTVRT